jgi:hypothetical protein
MYRKRAEEARVKAEATEEPAAREALLRTAEVWDRMAAYEETHNPWHPSDPH